MGKARIPEPTNKSVVFLCDARDLLAGALEKSSLPDPDISLPEKSRVIDWMKQSEIFADYHKQSLKIKPILITGLSPKDNGYVPDNKPSDASKVLMEALMSNELPARGEAQGEMIDVPFWVFRDACDKNVDFVTSGELPRAADGNYYRFLCVKYGDLKRLIIRIVETGNSEKKKPGPKGADYQLIGEILEELVQENPELSSETRAYAAKKAIERYRERSSRSIPKTERIVDKCKATFDKLDFKKGFRST